MVVDVYYRFYYSLGQMNNTTQKTDKAPTWSKTKNGLRQYLRPGPNHKIWYINCRVGNQIVNESTGSTQLTIAKVKLNDKLNVLLKQPRIEAINKTDKLNLGDCVEIFKLRFDSSDLHDLTKEKRGNCLQALILTWADCGLKKFGLGTLSTVLPKEISYDHLLIWRKYFVTPEEKGGAGYSADYFNKTLRVVRELFAIAIERHQIHVNPAERVEAATVKRKEVIVPTTEELEQILASPILTQESRDLCNALRYTGLRKDEANNLLARHVDLVNWRLVLPAHICKNETKGREVPIFEEARPLFTRLVEDAGGPEAHIFQVESARRQLKKAAKAVELFDRFPKIDHHLLRHYFATRCLECTKDVQVVAKWLGHSDNGKLVLEVYAHVCAQFMNTAAALVKFGSRLKAA